MDEFATRRCREEPAIIKVNKMKRNKRLEERRKSIRYSTKQVVEDTFSKNDLAEKIVGKRILKEGTIIYDAPFELGYHCPRCKYKHITKDEYDERLDWSEYNGFIWCRTCNKDYPSVMCEPNHDKAIITYLKCVQDAKHF